MSYQKFLARLNWPVSEKQIAPSNQASQAGTSSERVSANVLNSQSFPLRVSIVRLQIESAEQSLVAVKGVFQTVEAAAVFCNENRI